MGRRIYKKTKIDSLSLIIWASFVVFVYRYYLRFVIGIAVFLLILYIIGKVLKGKRLLDSNIQNIDQMTGIQFENYLAEVFRKQGYRVNLTPEKADYGADIVIEKDGVKNCGSS